MGHSNRPIYDFPFRPGGGNFEIRRKLYGLTDPVTEDVYQWVEEVRETASLCNWTEELAVEIIKSIVSPAILTLVKQRVTVDTFLDSII